MTPGTFTPFDPSDDPRPRLCILTCSTRPGRAGPAVARWTGIQAHQFGGFEVELVDLADLNLPVYDEPQHPRTGMYAHEHTKHWSAIVERADAFVFVTPEYNFGAPSALINALTFLNSEWAAKPAAFVSYGGVSAGTRGVQMAKDILTTLKVMPLPEAVNIPFFGHFLGEGAAVYAGDAMQEAAAEVMLTELRRWALAMMPLRSPVTA
jgi:NAD(P)H-dependent FMN reductase